jgi:hypothetical protein
MKAMELAVAQEDSCCKIPITLIDRASCPQTRKQSRNPLVESWYAFKPKPLKLALSPHEACSIH